MANSFTAVSTVVAGTAGTAAWANAQVRDNMDFLATSKPNCRAFNSAAISITTSGTPQALTLDSERFDKGAGSHSTVTNTGRLTVPSSCAGVYLTGAYTSWASNTSGVRVCAIRLNGATTIGADSKNTRSDGFCDHSPATLYALSVGDYLEIVMTQSSGGALNVAATPELWWTWQSN